MPAKENGLKPKAGRLLNLNQAAEYLGWTIWEIRRFVWTGEVPHIIRGKKRIFIDRKDIDAWIDKSKRTFREEL